LTVDTGADLSLVRTLHDRLAAAGRPFAVREALALMEADPTLGAINADVRQRGWRE
jgi:spore coat polysaccharide biosynthesis protein SpsF (cytidylyltransferase family)